MFTLASILEQLAAAIGTKFARVKLADDGTRFSAVSNVVTPSIIKAEIIAQYQQLEDGGYVQDSAAFSQNLVVSRNAQNVNRVDVLFPATLINTNRISVTQPWVSTSCASTVHIPRPMTCFPFERTALMVTLVMPLMSATVGPPESRTDIVMVRRI